MAPGRSWCGGARAEKMSSKSCYEREQIDAAGTKLVIERTAIDKEWVIERLRENVERAMQAQPVLDRAGNSTGSYVYNGATANRALELLGKELGMFIERRENKIVDEFDSMTDEQIEAWLDERAEARVMWQRGRTRPVFAIGKGRRRGKLSDDGLAYPARANLNAYACWRLGVGSASERARGGRNVKAMATAPRPMANEPI
jgi:hypothetical protein